MKVPGFFTSLAVLVSIAIYAEGWEVLVVDAASEPGQEFQVLSGNVKEIQGEAVNYTRAGTRELKNETLADYNAVWLGWNCSSDDGTYFRQGDADVIADYVNAGGVLVTSATDDSGWNSEWLPASLTVLNTGDYNLDVTEEGKEIFSNPNNVNPAAPVMDERYSAIDKAWTILAWGQGMVDSEAGAMQIALGKGLYLLVSIDTRDAGKTQSALPLMENMLNYAVAYTKAGMAVEPLGKLGTTWAELKNER